MSATKCRQVNMEAFLLSPDIWFKYESKGTFTGVYSLGLVAKRLHKLYRHTAKYIRLHNGQEDGSLRYTVFDSDMKSIGFTEMKRKHSVHAPPPLVRPDYSLVFRIQSNELVMALDGMTDDFEIRIADDASGIIFNGQDNASVTECEIPIVPMDRPTVLSEIQIYGRVYKLTRHTFSQVIRACRSHTYCYLGLPSDGSQLLFKFNLGREDLEDSSRLYSHLSIYIEESDRVTPRFKDFKKRKIHTQ